MKLLDTMPRRTAHSLRALAWLLRYPDAQLMQALPQISQALVDEAAVGASRLAELQALIEWLLRRNALEAEAEYVELFDRGRRTSLMLFEHVHGDSRERGAAMVDLVQTYERAGLMLDASELPDHLGVLLEFASTQPPRAAAELLGEVAHILRALFSGLLDKASPYAAVLGAALELAGEKAERVPLPPEPASEADLDASWAEPEAFGGCSSTGQSRPGQPQPIHIHRPARQPQRRAA
jgi:nitrate reductase delta subunit